jgi:hypothetical protein
MELSHVVLLRMLGPLFCMQQLISSLVCKRSSAAENGNTTWGFETVVDPNHSLRTYKPSTQQ